MTSLSLLCFLEKDVALSYGGMVYTPEKYISYIKR